MLTFDTLVGLVGLGFKHVTLCFWCLVSGTASLDYELGMVDGLLYLDDKRTRHTRSNMPFITFLLSEDRIDLCLDLSNALHVSICMSRYRNNSIALRGDSKVQFQQKTNEKKRRIDDPNHITCCVTQCKTPPVLGKALTATCLISLSGSNFLNISTA